MVFIAGNHDTLLDEESYGAPPGNPDSVCATARRMLQELISQRPNIHYLDNSGITLMGLSVSRRVVFLVSLSLRCIARVRILACAVCIATSMPSPPSDSCAVFVSAVAPPHHTLASAQVRNLQISFAQCMLGSCVRVSLILTCLFLLWRIAWGCRCGARR